MAPRGLYPEIVYVTNTAAWHLLVRELFEAPDGLRLTEHTEFVRTLVASIDARTPPTTQWHTAAILCTTALTASKSPEWARRHKHHWRTFLVNCLEDARPEPPRADFADCLRRRRIPVGTAVIDSAEALGRYELPQHIAGLPELERFRLVTTDMCVLARDLLRLDRELTNAHNAVVAYRTQHCLDWSDAQTQVLAIYHRRRRELHELTARIPYLPAVAGQPLTDQVTLRTYLHDLWQVTHGFAAAHLINHRHWTPFHTR
ncbi:terpene synthase family protein [Streptomyces sp. CMB-StM0423]|uniref:terpene synthase family protein n=1 Tax=Streptomyces sp. CMB-StM0423 TaxID=2059884 RepID=UPI00131BF154|nr:terpene synthase family protein [Streptomyces sp. CMB-StM0423]